MSAGLQVWDASGTLIVDTSFFLGRIVGSVLTNFVAGSVSADLSNGTPFAFSVVTIKSGYSPIGSPGGALYNPSITKSSSGISWTFPSNIGSTAMYENCIIYYGIY